MKADRYPNERNSRFPVKTIVARSFIAAAACGFLAACALIAHYDQVAYEHATSAKVDTLALMDKATGSYDEHQKEIEALVTELNKAYEYDRGRSLNKITVAQWDVLRDPNRNLVGGFLKMWKAKGSLSATFIAEKKLQIADGFDQIIALESGKLKPTEVKQ
jgi:hypothetical protein